MNVLILLCLFLAVASTVQGGVHDDFNGQTSRSSGSPHCDIKTGGSTRHERSNIGTGENLAETPCTPGEKRMEDCNYCTCNSNGKGYMCTRKACRPKRDTKPAVNGPGYSCKPGESFMNDCNHCLCSSDGLTAACTLKLCIH